MPPSGPPTEQEIWKIARRTTDIIEANITPDVCLFGSAASALWVDIGRVPNVSRCHSHSIHIFLFDLTRWLVFNTQDIDVVVSSNFYDAEDIKDIIEGADDRYFLEQSRKPRATHCILYCRLPGYATDKTRRVKVDILVPPTLNLPAISASERYHINNIPVMPIFELLVMKTRGWRDHRNSYRADYRAKESADVSDIFALLARAKQQNVSYIDEADEGRHSPEFLNLALTLANGFVRVYRRPRQWRALGFPIKS
jgi:hypothetical protein